MNAAGRIAQTRGLKKLMKTRNALMKDWVNAEALIALESWTMNWIEADQVSSEVTHDDLDLIDDSTNDVSDKDVDEHDREAGADLHVSINPFTQV